MYYPVITTNTRFAIPNLLGARTANVVPVLEGRKALA